MARPKLDVLDLDPEDCRISRHYITWMSSGNSAHRAEARAAERRYEGRQRLREDARDLGEGSSRAPAKERLGSRKAAVWESLKVTEKKIQKVRTDASRKREKETSRKSLFVWKRRENDKGVEESKEKKKEEKKDKEDE